MFHIHDFPNISHLNQYFIYIYIYIYDMNIIVSSNTISDLSELMNSELKKFLYWLAINKLILNIDVFT